MYTASKEPLYIYLKNKFSVNHFTLISDRPATIYQAHHHYMLSDNRYMNKVLNYAGYTLPVKWLGKELPSTTGHFSYFYKI
jgi:hypothetical protein